MHKFVLWLTCVAALFLTACTATPTARVVIVTATSEANTPPPGPSETTAPPTAFVPDAIDCSEAAAYVGEIETVCGEVVDSKYAPETNGQPTFLNLCKPYPDPDRFTVLIWGRNRQNFPPNPEQFYLGRKICVSGLVEDYQGIAEIEASDRTQIAETG